MRRTAELSQVGLLMDASDPKQLLMLPQCEWLQPANSGRSEFIDYGFIDVHSSV